MCFSSSCYRITRNTKSCLFPWLLWRLQESIAFVNRLLKRFFDILLTPFSRPRTRHFVFYQSSFRAAKHYGKYVIKFHDNSALRLPSFNNSRYYMGQFTGDTVLDNRSNHEWDLGLCNSIPPSPPLLPPWRAMRLISIFFSPSEGLFHNSFFDQCLLLLFCDRKDRQGNRNNNASRDLFSWNYLLSPAARSLWSTAYKQGTCHQSSEGKCKIFMIYLRYSY